MIWETGYYYAPRYKYVSCNQHGDRFKRKGSKRLSIAKLSCKHSDAAGMSHLILMSHSLDVPVHYDFKDHTAYIEVMSSDAVRDKI